MRVETLGNNQVLVHNEDLVYFFSYDTEIAWKMFDSDRIHLSKYWDYSATTLKYLKKAFNITDSKAQIIKNERGLYIFE